MQGKILPQKENGLFPIELSPERQGCESCATKGFCKLPDSEVIEVPGSQLPEGVAPGDTVEVDLKPADRVLLSFSVFIVPLLFMIAGAFFGSRTSEGWAMGGGFIGLLIGLLLIVLLHRRASAMSRIHITRC